MATSISEEEFLRLQNQLIELRTANYSLEEQYAHQVANNRQLKLRVELLEKECHRAQTSLNMARKLKTSDLIQQNETLQLKLQNQEDEFRLQNQTLLQELSALSAENDKLMSVISLTADEVESSLDVNEKVKKLRCEANALRRALSEERLRSAQEIARLRDSLRTYTEDGEEERISDIVGASGIDSTASSSERDQDESESLIPIVGSSAFNWTPRSDSQDSGEKKDTYTEYITVSWKEAQQELENMKFKIEKLKTECIREAVSSKSLQDKNEALEKRISDMDETLSDYKIVSGEKISILEGNLKLAIIEQEKHVDVINNYQCRNNELEDQVQNLNKEIAANHLEKELVDSQLLEATKTIEELKANNIALETDYQNLSKSTEETKVQLKNYLDLTEKQNLEKDIKIRNFEQQLLDLAAERVLNEKKGAVICRDLKRQLASERRRVEKLQEKQQEIPDTTVAKIGTDGAKSLDVETASNSSWSLMSGNMEHQESSTRESSLVAGSPTNLNGNMFPQPDELDLDLENKNLLERLTSLQEEKWILEEKINHLEQGSAAMAEDLVKKSNVIKFYCMEGRPDSQPSSSGKKAVKKLSDFLKSSEEEHILEYNGRMQRMLEEVLTKNLYLQRDIEQMSQELEKLRLVEKPEAEN